MEIPYVLIENEKWAQKIDRKGNFVEFHCWIISCNDE